MCFEAQSKKKKSCGSQGSRPSVGFLAAMPEPAPRPCPEHLATIKATAQFFQPIFLSESRCFSTVWPVQFLGVFLVHSSIIPLHHSTHGWRLLSSYTEPIKRHSLATCTSVGSFGRGYRCLQVVLSIRDGWVIEIKKHATPISTTRLKRKTVQALKKIKCLWQERT